MAEQTNRELMYVIGKIWDRFYRLRSCWYVTASCHLLSQIDNLHLKQDISPMTLKKFVDSVPYMTVERARL